GAVGMGFPGTEGRAGSSLWNRTMAGVVGESQRVAAVSGREMGGKVSSTKIAVRERRFESAHGRTHFAPLPRGKAPRRYWNAGPNRRACRVRGQVWDQG